MLLQVIPPHPDLSAALMHFMVLSFDGGQYHLPSALSPALILFARGSAIASSGDGPPKATPRFTVSGPYLTPRHAVSAPDTIALAVLFRPGYLQPALDIHPSDIVGSEQDMREVADAAAINAMFDALDSTDSIPNYIQIFQNYLLSTFAPTRKKIWWKPFSRLTRKYSFP